MIKIRITLPAAIVPVLTFLLLSGTASSQNALPNPGFEDWTTTDTYQDPDGWSTTNSLTNLVGVVLTSKATLPAEVHSGNAALKSETHFVGAPVSQNVPGLVTTGTLQFTTQTIDGGTPYTSRPDSIGGWYRYAGVDGDSAYITFFLFSFFRDTVGRAIFKGGNTEGAWRWFSAPLVYELPSNPFTAYFIIAPGPRNNAHEGSTLWLDDMEILFSTGLEEEDAAAKLGIYPNPASNRLVVEKAFNEEVLLTVSDLAGQAVVTCPVTEQRHELQLTLPSGMYSASFSIEGQIIKNEKLIICN